MIKRHDSARLWRPEHSEGATSGLRVSKERRSHWMRYLHLEKAVVTKFLVNPLCELRKHGITPANSATKTRKLQSKSIHGY